MSLNHCLLTLGLAMVAVLAVTTCGRADEPDNDARAGRFIRTHEQDVRPLEIEVARRWWNANVSGKEDDYRRKEEAETRLELRLSEPGPFAELKAIHAQPIRDPIVAREIEVLYLEYLGRQVDPALLKQMLAASNKAEKAFSVFRATVDGRELTDNEVRDVLRRSNDSARRRAVWEASKRVGSVVEPDLRHLIALRNQAARSLGFKNYYVMQLSLGEQSQEQVLKLFDELDALTRGPFHAVKGEIDAKLAARFGVAVEGLRPWHYQDPFFQEPPDATGAGQDAIYRSIDIVKVCREFYAGIGLPVDDVLARSDLFERKGKNPHGFCTDIDRVGDVRVLTNIVPDKQWLATLLHELGHSTYSSKNIPESLPYVLRSEAHALSTEAVAMMFERFAGNADWLSAMGVSIADRKAFQRAAFEARRNQLLIFSRWCQVMFRFEKSLYEDPDQDLNRRWWDLVERYQELRRPECRNEPDYASKIHVVMAPVYYHNYLLGELFAAQLHHAIARDVLGGVRPADAVYVGNRAVGEFMKSRVYAPGRSLGWQQLARHATGEDLSAKAFAADIEGK